VFNLADVAIVAGVGLLLFESVVMTARKESAPT
jgi:lipoprotein signal peptidase